MSWTTPRTWNAGETVTSSMMNAHLRDNLNVLKTNIGDDGALTIRVLKSDKAIYTITNTSIVDMWTGYSVPANTLTDGDILRFTFWGDSTASAGGTTSPLVYFAFGDMAMQLSANPPGAGNTITSWRMEVTVVCTGAASHIGHGLVEWTDSGSVSRRQMSAILTGTAAINATIAVKTQARAQAAANNVRQRLAMIELLRKSA